MEKEPVANKWKWLKRAYRFAKFTLIVGVLVGGCFAVVHAATLVWDAMRTQAAYAYEWGRERVTITKVVERVEILEPEKVPLLDLINQTAQEEGVHPAIIQAIAMQESGGELDPLRAVRYEPCLLYGCTRKDGTWRKAEIVPPKGLTEAERMFWASSIGPFQIIYGFHYRLCELKHFSELYDVTKGLRCAIRIVKQKLKETARIREPGDRMREVFKRYNGGGADAQAYSIKTMGHLDNILMQGFQPLTSVVPVLRENPIELEFN